MKRVDFGKLTPADVDSYRHYGLTRYTYDEIQPVYDKCAAVESEAENILGRIDEVRAYFDKNAWDFVTFPRELDELINLSLFDLCGMFSQSDQIEKFPLTVWKKNMSGIKKGIKKAYPLIAAAEWWVFMDSNQPDEIVHSELANQRRNVHLIGFDADSRWLAFMEAN